MNEKYEKSQHDILRTKIKWIISRFIKQMPSCEVFCCWFCSFPNSFLCENFQTQCWCGIVHMSHWIYGRRICFVFRFLSIGKGLSMVEKPWFILTRFLFEPFQSSLSTFKTSISNGGSVHGISDSNMPGGTATPGTPVSKAKDASPRIKIVVALYPFKAIEGGDLSLEKVGYFY